MKKLKKTAPKKSADKSVDRMKAQIASLQAELDDAKETLRAIQSGEVDALVVRREGEEQVFTLHGAELPYRVVIETMNEGMATLSNDGTVLYCNSRFAEILGENSGKIIGQTMNRFISGSQLAQFELMLERSREQTVRGEFLMRSADGRDVPVYSSLAAIKDPAAGICMVVTDIGELKKIQKALMETNETLERRVVERTEALRKSEEDLQISNEELVAINEELLTSNDELRATHEELLRNEERFRSVLDDSQDVIYRLNLQTGSYEYISPSSGTVVGFSPDELKEQNAKGSQTMIHPDDLPAMRAALARLEETGKEDVEYRQMAKSGEYRWLSNHMAMIRDDAGRPLYRDGSIRDITWRKRTEESIKRKSLILTAMNRIFEETISSGTRTQLGEKCLEIAEELTGSKFGFIGEINERGMEDVAISNPGWDACKIIEDGHRRPSGSFKIHGIYGRVLNDGKSLIANDPASHPDRIGIPAGHPPLESFLGVPLIYNAKTIGMIAVGNRPGGYSQEHQEALEALAPVVVESFMRKQAEEKLKQLMEELKRSNTDLEQFASVANHDLREPLRTITSFLQLLEKRCKGSLDKDAMEFINFAVDGAGRMDKLLAGLLNYSRVHSQGKPMKPVSVQDSLNDAMLNLRKIIAESNAEIVSEPLPTLNADWMQLTQLFQNLIHNAIKFRSEQRLQIHITSKKEGNHFLFSVSDNGIGIEPQYHENIFTIFRRVNPKDERSGHGVGLAVCKKIVERHGGKIWLESTPGKGSTFFFTIPC